MNSHRRSLAIALIGTCAALLPPDRRVWAAAMKAELNAIEDGDAALSFAAGCVWGSIKERTMTMEFVGRTVRFMTIAGMLALSLVSARVADRMADVQGPSFMVFGLTSALFGLAAVWTYLRGPMALVQTATVMIPLYLLSYVFVSAQKGAGGVWINARLYEALAVEGLVIWAALLAAGIFMLRAGTSFIARRT